MRGSAYDDWTDGGPYLWVFDRKSGQGDPQLLYQINLNTRLPTGFAYDVSSDFPNLDGIAGGLWTAQRMAYGQVFIGGVLSGTPDMFFVYELTQGGPYSFKLVEPTSGTVPPDSSDRLTVRLFGVWPLPPFIEAVRIESNDPSQPSILVPIYRYHIGIDNEEPEPEYFEVSQNYPNPFNATTIIQLELPEAMEIEITIYNLLGQKVRTLVDKKLSAGHHQVKWDGRDEKGLKVSSGIYLYRVESDHFQKIHKMILIN